jgi:PhoPQ-activated pathogenicity-related protein
MAKASLNIMKAVTEFAVPKSLLEQNAGNIAMGVSKRGWTSWMIGAADTSLIPGCPPILGIAPLAPIVPSMLRDMHRQWRSYSGFSFTFKPFMDVGLLDHLDDETVKKGMLAIDPLSFQDQLKDVAKFAIMGSGDEFMQMDWTSIWSDELDLLGSFGEQHLSIAPNAEHTLLTNIYAVLSNVITFSRSLATGQTAAERPSFTHFRDNTTGEIGIKIADGFKPEKVLLRHAYTRDAIRRDFRMIRQENDDTPACSFPDIRLSTPILGGNCLSIKWWHETLLAESESEPGVYKALPPDAGNVWVGYYIQVYFHGGQGHTWIVKD